MSAVMQIHVMDFVYERIDAELKRTRGQRGGWAWLARQLDLGVRGSQVVQNWKTRGVPPEHYIGIAEVLGWTVEELVGKAQPREPGMKHPVTRGDDLSYAGRPKTSMRVPVVGTAKLGSDGYYVELETPTGYGDGYVEHYSRDGNAYGVRVKGDSMHPAIKHGQVVVVEPNGELVPGENVLLSLRDGRKMVKELIIGRADSVTVASVNGGERLTFSREEIEWIHSIAAVVSASKWRPE
ncbi:MAG: S24 family peptidase [Burkholderiaceae bacterium]|nr:S24 family peptidase [Burkholderiaceae bacterium]